MFMLERVPNIYKEKKYFHSIYSILLFYIFHSGDLLVGGTKFDKRRKNQAHNVDTFVDVFVPIPPQGISQYLCDAKDAEGHWLYIWDNLVGIRPQSYCLFHRVSCKPAYYFIMYYLNACDQHSNNMVKILFFQFYNQRIWKIYNI